MRYEDADQLLGEPITNLETEDADSISVDTEKVADSISVKK